MIQVAICDDSSMDRELLQKIVNLLMEDRGVEFKLSIFNKGEDLVDNYGNHPFDLIFLDIMMGDVNGMDAGRRIREKDSNVEIVFCTSSKDFAIAAYEIHALGYLLKPYESSKIGATIDYYLQKHPQNDQNFIEVKSQRRTVIIPYKDIIFMESSNKVVYIHTTKQGEIKVYKKLDDLEKQVMNQSFLRCHQSYFINMSYVAGIVESDFVMHTSNIIPIRKSGRKLIKKQYEDFLKQSLQQRKSE